MAKSDARFGYKADLGRQDFDLSQKLGFTSASGMLLPIWEDFASPGDSFYLQHDLPLLRSTNLAAPAMVDVKVHFDTFFVPMQMIYQPFENTMFSLKNIQSSNYSMAALMNNNFPLWDYNDFVSLMLGTEMTTDYHTDMFRLADLFGLCPDNFCTTTSTGQQRYTPSFFPWQMLAYHTIFEYFYRLDDKSQFDNQFCNWDKYYGTSSPIQMTRDFASIHQRPWNFDYFTSMYRSPIISDDNLQRVLPNANYSNLTNFETRRMEKDGTTTTPLNSVINAFTSDSYTSFSAAQLNAAHSTAMIRQMFANEKLAMITGRTKKNYDSQVLAHYGVNVPHDVKHDLTLIHHDEYDLNVAEVTSLADTSFAGPSGGALGELAGKSYASGNGKQFKFTAPCHGVIMTIFSIEPQKRYISCFDRQNAITNAFDFPTPEFDRLGNMPMFRYECGYNINQSTFAMSDIVGWKERYYQFKRKYDKCSYAFATGTGVGFNNYSAFMIAERPFGESADNSAWVGGNIDQRPDLENRFYIERNAVDNLCLVQFAYGWKHSTDTGVESWSNTPWLVYARDPFIINSFIKAKKVSWMSKDGEPIYNF